MSVIESEKDLSEHDSYDNTVNEASPLPNPKQIKLAKVDHFSVDSMTSLKDQCISLESKSTRNNRSSSNLHF